MHGLRLSARVPPVLASSPAHATDVPKINAPLLPEILRRAVPSAQQDLPLAAQGVQRYVWESQWGSMLIEVIGAQVFVDGKLVEPFRGS